MGDLAALLDWPGAATWGVFAFATVGTGLIDASRHVVRAWRQWRLDRRLARNPYILREELNEYRFRIGDELPSLDPARLVGSSLAIGVLAAILARLAELNLEHWWEYGHLLMLAAGLLYATWRWHNDPPEARGERHPVLHAFLGERDAVLGLGSAIVIVLLILFAVFALF
jgi:hypothetical protein